MFRLTDRCLGKEMSPASWVFHRARESPPSSLSFLSVSHLHCGICGVLNMVEYDQIALCSRRRCSAHQTQRLSRSDKLKSPLRVSLQLRRGGDMSAYPTRQFPPSIGHGRLIYDLLVGRVWPEPVCLCMHGMFSRPRDRPSWASENQSSTHTDGHL